MVLAPRTAGEVVLENVSRGFGKIQVLQGINLSLEPGTVAEILGHNGSGKTSLLRILAGTLSPDAGRVTVSGRPPGQGMAALVPAGDRALYWRLTGQQELEFYARIAGRSRREAEDVAAAAAAMLSIADLKDRQIGTFSTGQRRRLMVARSLVGRSPVLLLDEPYSDLDETACGLVELAVRGWTNRGGLAVWTSPIAGGGPQADVSLRLRAGELLSA